jgi:hypothetical protein
MWGNFVNYWHALFTSQALKAWVAGLVGALALYLGPIITDWVANLTPEMIVNWFTGFGVNISLVLAGVVAGAIGVVWTYITKNKE